MTRYFAAVFAVALLGIWLSAGAFPAQEPKPGQLPAEFGDSLTCRITIFGRKRHEVLPNVIVGKHPHGAHLAVDIEEELTPGPHFSVQRFDRGAGVRRMMKYSVRDDKIKRFIRERGIH